MSLNVSQRIILGFALLLLLLAGIGLTGFNSSGAINSKLRSVTEETTPLLKSSYEQNLHILSAQNALQYFLRSSLPERMDAQRQAFQQEIDAFNSEQQALQEHLPSDSGIRDQLQQASSKAEEYAKLATTLQDQHQQQLLVEEKLRTEKQQVDRKESSLSNILRNYALQSERQFGVSGPQIQSNALLQELTRTSTFFARYETSLDIAELAKSLEGQDKNINDRFTDFEQADAKQAAKIKVLVNQIVNSITSDTGLFALYRQQDQLSKDIRSALETADTQLTETLSTLRELINQADQASLQATQAADATITASRGIISAVSAIALVVAILVGWWVVSSIRRPLAEFSTILGKVTEGDLRPRFDTNRKDEFGKLGERLNGLTSTLQQLIMEMTSEASRLAEMAEQNAQISDQSMSAVNQQKLQLTSTATAMTEMESTVNSVAEQAQYTLVSVDNAGQLTDKVKDSVSQTLTSIDVQVQQMIQASKVTQELNKYSQSIGSILDAIGNIAGQTNLLALNAAIEAARAGEQGRGFAVVADEVRTLASRTQASTGEIQQMIEQMRGSITDVVKVMESSQRQTDECASAANAARQTLEEMYQAIATIRDLNLQIASATEQQSSTTQDISHNVLSISEAAERTATGAGRTAQSSQQMLELARNQRQLLQRFTA
ncbi:methyl-accepting chemotaxis protein [Pokkaliibacter sp. MBI-7]|uniref:methyl-accepting chemotaxis protein n=1 Tax=Pokkaliibacter sp. MBI-7 TaxID=3040600 RepID=UPI00244929C7|nr:methyl-accepting chemotaxis protein [Pokkaliibacter sp. MBI-7]MDH2436250.1 methyl-accepting chemotaxis protein [Pokkaliibacter sp. MBI-7]